MSTIDAHHHLWHYSPAEFDWIDDSMSALRRDFLPDMLQGEARSAGVDGTVVVQARQTIQETDWLLDIAQCSATIWGVVGWLPLAAPDFASVLARYADHPMLRGLRHVVQAEAPGFLEGTAFNRGISALRSHQLVYDLLLYAPQLPEAIAFVDRHPAQSFVLDHIAKPRIRTGEIASWSTAVRELARRPNVTCKVSGMVTEADPAHWSEAALRPYFDVVLEAFGPDRLMVGTDWPVLTVGCTYAGWWRVVRHWMAGLSAHEQQQILGETALRVYGLVPPEAATDLHKEGVATA